MTQVSATSQGSAIPAPIRKRSRNQGASAGNSGSARIAAAPTAVPNVSARTGPSRRTQPARNGPQTSIASACIELFSPISVAGSCQPSSVRLASGISIPSVSPAPTLAAITAVRPSVRWRGVSWAAAVIGVLVRSLYGDEP